MRLLAIILGGLLAALLLVAITVPFWLGGALAWAGPSFGLRFADYERLGYARFRLEDVVFERPPVVVRIEHVEADTPLLWLGRKVVSQPRLVRAGDWSVVVTPRGDRPRPAGPRGWTPLRARLERVADRLAEWLPHVEAGPGTVSWTRGQLTFDRAEWRERTLVCPRMGYRDFAARVELDAVDDEPWRVVLQAEGHDLSAELLSTGASVDGQLAWLGERAGLEARFPDSGWIPSEASLVASDWQVPAGRARLGKHYEQLSGSAHLAWKDGRLNADVTASGRPKEDSPAPPLTVQLRGNGEVRAFAIESLEVTLPGVMARLSEPVVIDRRGQLQSDASSFTLAAELAQVPWVDAAGALAGEGRISRGEQGRVNVDFAFRGEGIALAQTKLQRVRASGRLEWPRLRITEAVVTAENGDTLESRGEWDFQARELIGASATGRLSRASLAPWWPKLPEFDALEIEAQGAGPWPAVKHEGQARISELRTEQLKPVAAALQWQGVADRIEEFSTELTARETRVHASGSADRSRVTLDTFAFTRGDSVHLELVDPATLRWRPQGGIEMFRLRGTDALLELGWSAGERHQLTAAVQGFRLAWLADLVNAPPVLTVDSAKLHAEWETGPMEFGLEALMTLNLDGGRMAQLSTRLRGDGKGIEVALLRVAEEEADIVNATGRFPVVIRPAGEPRVAIDLEAPFTLNAMTSANPEFWDQLAQLAGVEIVEPEARARLSGTLAQPRGEARFRAQRIAAEAGRFPWRWPRVEQLDMYFIAEQDGLRLEQFAVEVQGQSIRASGWLPVEAARWRELLRNPHRLVRRGELRVNVPDLDLAAVAGYFPTYLAPKGRAELDVTLGEDGGARGFLRVRDATLRPLGPLGVVQEINAEVRFDGRAAVVQTLSGRMGGQIVALEGRAELTERGRPDLNFRLTGANLPFVRRAGLLVRGDLDLTLTTPEEGPPAIGGTLRLRDSLFLADLRALIPSGTRGSEGRPPYFSIETPPLNNWTLDVAVQGERFLRLRTPIFNGTATARFRLSGRLGDPRATGEALIDDGVIRLPFASFEVRQGQVRLTNEQVQPQIWVSATTRRYGYDLRLELTGPVSAPQLTFSSSPPLESEQILLLVMTGQPPSDEVATTNRQRVARFGAFFGQSLLGSLSSDPTGADRLTITSGEDISEQGRETYNIEYRLNDEWSLTGEYDEFDEYYGGVKWRFYEKGGEDDDAD